MNLWLIALILAVANGAPTAPQGDTVFATGFDEESDTNYDTWPDGWTRRRGEGFPQYLAIGIADDPDQEHARCLRITLDGGAATLFSPPIPVDPRFSYLLAGRIKTRRLKHDIVYYSLTFFDAQRRQQEAHQSPALTQAADWRDVQIGPVRPASTDVCYAVVGVHVAPTAQADLVGTALFDDICLARLPYMVLATAQPHNLFRDPDAVTIDCGVAGLPDRELAVRLELLDVYGVVHDTAELALAPVAAGEVVVEGTEPSTAPAPPAPSDLCGWQRAVTWRPAVPAPGHYTVRGTLLQRGTVVWRHTVELAVMRVGPRPAGTEFAWSLPDVNRSVTPSQLVAVLRQSQVGWLKYPLPADPDAHPDLEQLALLAESLRAEGIQMVGVLGPSIASRAAASDRLAPPPARDWFRNPALGPATCDPLLKRLGLTVSHWQLGADGDGSFADDPHCVELVRGVRERWRREGHYMRLGVAWPWLYPVPGGADLPWDFVARSEPLPFTAEELGRYGAAIGHGAAAQWVTLLPLSATHYSAPIRARDLVLRLVTAKQSGHRVIAVHDPLDEDHGLLCRQGTPTALYLPWCVTAELLGGAKHLGSIVLPQGSPNQVFARDGTAVMVVWNDRTVTETMYLGDAARQVDPWGRETAVATTDVSGMPAQSVVTGPMPLFLTGLDLPLILWQLHCSLEPAQLATGDGVPEVLRLTTENTFPRDVEGTCAVRAPASWNLRGELPPLRLAEQESVTRELVVRLHPDADQGLQRIEIACDVAADRRHQFRVYRDVQVGTGDVLLALDSWLDAAGQLRVEQRVTNTTATPISVNCYLQAPGRRRLRHQILDLPLGHATHTFVLPDGAALAGRTLVLRVEEIGGKRQWNTRALVDPPGGTGVPAH
jgi:hypothetical protein